MTTTYNPYEAPKTDFTDTQAKSAEHELASIKERVLAFIIDLLVIFAVFIGLGIATEIAELFVGTNSKIKIWIGYSPTLLSFNLFNPWVWIDIFVFNCLYLAVNGVLLHRHGQSIGKRFLKIAIVDADTYERVPLPRLYFSRYLIWEVPYLFNVAARLIIYLVDLAFGLRKTRRTLHDLTANTIVSKVVYAPNYSAPTLDRLARKAQSRGTRKVI